MGASAPTRSLVLLLLASILSCFLHGLQTDALGLPPNEREPLVSERRRYILLIIDHHEMVFLAVDALRKVATKLNIPATLWDFNADPCSWSTQPQGPLTSNLTCDCNANASLCHVSRM